MRERLPEGRHGKVLVQRWPTKPKESVWFNCPGCDEAHGYTVPEWTFNGDFDRPTFSPSLLVTRPNNPNYLCHLFMTDGQIRFLDDCTHALAGQTVPVPAPPDWLD